MINRKLNIQLVIKKTYDQINSYNFKNNMTFISIIYNHSVHNYHNFMTG